MGEQSKEISSGASTAATISSNEATNLLGIYSPTLKSIPKACRTLSSIASFPGLTVQNHGSAFFAPVTWRSLDNAWQVITTGFATALGIQVPFAELIPIALNQHLATCRAVGRTPVGIMNVTGVNKM